MKSALMVSHAARLPGRQKLTDAELTCLAVTHAYQFEIRPNSTRTR
ncbi:hypothetical protein [Nocardia sp. NPDC005998]